MKELKKLDPENKKYYLLDNARVHKTKSLMNMVHNIPYHLETNPIKDIFSMFRNYLNR